MVVTPCSASPSSRMPAPDCIMRPPGRRDQTVRQNVRNQKARLCKEPQNSRLSVRFSADQSRTVHKSFPPYAVRHEYSGCTKRSVMVVHHAMVFALQRYEWIGNGSQTMNPSRASTGPLSPGRDRKYRDAKGDFPITFSHGSRSDHFGSPRIRLCFRRRSQGPDNACGIASPAAVAQMRRAPPPLY